MPAGAGVKGFSAIELDAAGGSRIGHPGDAILPLEPAEEPGGYLLSP